VASPSDRPEWRALVEHAGSLRDRTLRELFGEDPQRAENMPLDAAGWHLDPAKHRVTTETLTMLGALAQAQGLRERTEAMFRGEHINRTEDRAVLHVALRMPKETSLVVDGVDVVREVHAVFDKMANFAQQVRSGEWRGHTGRPVRNVVNIGIGGSDLGPAMAYEALRAYTRRRKRFEFVSNVDGADLSHTWRVSTQAERTADELALLLSGLLAQEGISFAEQITGLVAASVVPDVTAAVREMAARSIDAMPVIVGPGTKTGVPILTDNPREVGSDRVVKAYAARALYGPPLIIVDVGTATTFDCVNARGEFIGGAIAPGLSTAADALINRAARLFRVELVRPKEAIGRNTVTNMQSGFVYGWAGLIDGLVERMRAEMDGEPTVIATGGLVSVVASAVRAFQVTNEHLALEGLRLLWERQTSGPASG
jgi:pantothenate kinase type III